MHFFFLFQQKDAALEIPGVLQLSMKISSISDEALELLAWVLDDPSFRLCTKNKTEVCALHQPNVQYTILTDM